MSMKSRLAAAASVTIVAMSAMATTNANAFTLFDPPCIRSAADVGLWRCYPAITETRRMKQTFRTHRSDTSPDYMKNTDPRFNQSMLDAGGGGGAWRWWRWWSLGSTISELLLTPPSNPAAFPGSMPERALPRPIRQPLETATTRSGSAGWACSRALAAAADALDLAVESPVFLAQRIVRVAQVLLAGQIGGARLPVTDRRLYCRPARILRTRRRPLRERVRGADQNHQRCREDCVSHSGSPVFLFLSIAPARRSLRNCGVPGRRSPAPFVHRPWRQAMIPAATNTTKKPSITAFSMPRWPSSSGGSRFPSPSSAIARHGFGG